MQRFRVTALTPVALSVEMVNDTLPIRLELGAGGTAIVRKVLRITDGDGTGPVNLVPHPVVVGGRVRVSERIELERLI